MSEEITYKIWWDEENQICRYEQYEDVMFTQKIADENSKLINNIIKDKPNPCYLLDLRNLRTIPDSQGRIAIIGLARKYSFMPIALLSGSTVMRVTINFMIRASGHKKIRAFTDEVEAIKWLKETR